MKKRIIFLLAFIIVTYFIVLTITKKNQVKDPEISIDTALALQYFNEAKEISDKDNGRLWGVKLYGPLMFVDHKTRIIVANRKDKEGNLKKKGKVYIGKLDKKQGVANTAIDWAGEKWTMIMWNAFSKNKYQRDWLIMHELWHRIQADIGLPMASCKNQHLDSFDGRILLKLEWRALRRALTKMRDERKEAIKDALIFRNFRQSKFKNADINESRFEMHEGLAEYTGVKLSGYSPDEILKVLDKRMKKAEKMRSFNWAFAYQSGPAYGILLDEFNINWRKDLKTTSDFGKILQKYLSIKLPKDLKKEAEKLYDQYDGEILIKSEREYEKVQKELKEKYLKQLVENPVLIIPLIKMNINFNPNEIFPLDDYGDVYKTARISDEWGILNITNGVLMSKDWGKVTVSAPIESKLDNLKGQGWELELQKGWHMVSTKDGNFVLKKKAQ